MYQKFRYLRNSENTSHSHRHQSKCKDSCLHQNKVRLSRYPEKVEASVLRNFFSNSKNTGHNFGLEERLVAQYFYTVQFSSGIL